MKTTIKEVSNTQYLFFLLLIFYALGVGALPAASSFYILGDLGGGIETASFAVSLFILGAITTKPLALILGNNIGKIKLLRMCLWAMLVLTVISFLVNGYYSFLVLRFLIGVSSGPIFLIATSMGGGLRAKEKLSGFIFTLILLMLVVPIFSAAFGAFISYQYTWQLSFFLFNFLLIPLVFFSYTLFANLEAPIVKEPIDLIGFFVFMITLMSLGFCLVAGQVIDGFRSTAFNLIFTLGSICLIFLIFWNIWQPHPILRFKILKDKRLLLNLFNTLALFLFFYAIVVLLSLWLHLYVNYSLNWVALSLLGTLIGPLFLFIAFKERSTAKAMGMLTLALILLSALAFYISTFNSEVNFGRILCTKLIAGVALAISLPPIITNIQNSVAEEDFSYAFCLFAMFRMLGSFIGVAYFVTLWQRRAVFFYERLGGELTLFSEQTKLVLMQLSRFGLTPAMKEAGLSEALIRQSQSLALDDCYYLMGWIMLVLVILSLFGLRKPKEEETKELVPKTAKN